MPAMRPLSGYSGRPVPGFQARAPLTALAVLALSAGLLFAPAVQAQSLKDLYEAARAYDAGYRAAQALARSADYRVAAVEGLARPSAALNSAASTSRVDPPVGGGGDSNSIGVTASARYPIINRSNDASIAQARKSLESTRADLETAEQDLIVRVAQAYFDVLTAQDTLATLRANKTAITEQLASAKRNFEVGTATITDTREVQARFDKASGRRDRGRQRPAHQTHRARPAGGPQSALRPSRWRCRSSLPPVLPADVEVWVGNADQHPAVRRARVGLDVATLETEKARAAEKFTLDAVGSLSGSPGQRQHAVGLLGQHARTPVSACSSTCRCTPGARRRTASRKPCCWRKSRARTWTSRAAR
jgi:outer membrane protein